MSDRLQEVMDMIWAKACIFEGESPNCTGMITFSESNKYGKIYYALYNKYVAPASQMVS